MTPTRLPRVSIYCLALLAGLVAAGCALNLPPIRLEGTNTDLQPLAGQWVGEYASDDLPGRGGSIVFILDAEQHCAHGDVIMTPRGTEVPLRRFDQNREPENRLLMTNQSLTILFVRAENGVISGELDPYWDPDLQVQARTMFEGVLAGDTIRGTYETRYLSPLGRTTGHWRVVRLK